MERELASNAECTIIPGTYTERNYGIDLLRLAAMFMVVVLHVLGNGGVLSSATGINYSVSMFLKICTYCAVDCYAIISGFVCYTDKEKPYKYSRFISFWVQVVTYSFGITLIAFLFRPKSIGLYNVFASAVPVASGQYWYVSAYAGLFFIIPWLNKMIRACTRKECTQLGVVLVAVYVLYATAARVFSDCFTLELGYSFAWLTILYVVGAWMKKCDIPSHCKCRHLLIGIGCCVLFAEMKALFLPENLADRVCSYTSIFTVYIAFALVSLFSKIKIGKTAKKMITCWLPAAFGVYLIHTQPIVWGHYIRGSFGWIAGNPAWLIPVLVLGSAFAVFAVCLLVEKVRLILFRVLKIDYLIGRVSNWTENWKIWNCLK